MPKTHIFSSCQASEDPGKLYAWLIPAANKVKILILFSFTWNQTSTVGKNFKTCFKIKLQTFRRSCVRCSIFKCMARPFLCTNNYIIIGLCHIFDFDIVPRSFARQHKVFQFTQYNSSCVDVPFLFAAFNFMNVIVCKTCRISCWKAIFELHEILKGT